MTLIALIAFSVRASARRTNLSRLSGVGSVFDMHPLYEEIQYFANNWESSEIRRLFPPPLALHLRFDEMSKDLRTLPSYLEGLSC